MARNLSNDLNKTRYTHRDYASIKEDLINAIPSLTQEWTSREEADPGIVLIKLMSMFGDTLSYNVDKIALELYIQTVTQRKNCAKILKLLGYKMHWYRSGRVMAHVRLTLNQDEEGNLGHVILHPYKTRFIAGNVTYSVVSQTTGSGDIDIYSSTDSTEVRLVEGTPVTNIFNKNVLVNNRYYFGNYNLDEKEIVVSIDKVINSKVTCKLVDNLYLVSSNSIIYYEFDIDEYDRPYIQLCDGWEDIAGTDTAEFTVTYLLSSGSQGNVSNNAFTSIVDYTSENARTADIVITNLSNATKYGEEENGTYLESYNTPGYSPQTVDDARKDSANYVFTHDTLVTSSDYEKAARRLVDITVSKLVDAQVIINDQLNLNDICYRALDHFNKVYVEEESLTNPEEMEINQYLLAYQVILYLAYKNFDPQLNYYYNIDNESFWCLKPLLGSAEVEDDDPYGRIFWEPSLSFESDGERKSWDHSDYGGPVTNKELGQYVTMSATVNEQEILSYSYDYATGEVVIEMGENTPLDVHGIVINTETNPQVINHFSNPNDINNPYPLYDDDGNCHFVINDNRPRYIEDLFINGNNLVAQTDPSSSEYHWKTWTFEGDGTTTNFVFAERSSSGTVVIKEVTINGHPTSNYSYAKLYNEELGQMVNCIEFDEAPPNGATVVVTYTEDLFVYDSENDVLSIITGGNPLLVSDVLTITKHYSKDRSRIQVPKEDGDYPNAILNLFINGEPINNYEYDKDSGWITLNVYINPDNVDTIIVNGKLITGTFVEDRIEMQPPGYYPYKPTDNVLLSVRELLSSLKILNVDIGFGTMKLFPFKVEGIVHLINLVSPQEALQIIEIIDEALVQAYYPDLHPIGEKPDFIEIVDIIQNADPRIKYFDAIRNIVEWAPEVQRGFNNFDDIFDTTSAIMYNGLSDNFNLNKRFLRFKFKNTPVVYNPDEDLLSEVIDTENGDYNIPSDYGTAYLVNYSEEAGLDYVYSVLPNTTAELQLDTIAELRALCADLTFNGFEYVRYIRHLLSSSIRKAEPDPLNENNTEIIPLTNIIVNSFDQLTFDIDSETVPTSIDESCLIITNDRAPNFKYTLEDVTDESGNHYQLTATQWFINSVSESTPEKGTKVFDVTTEPTSVTVNGTIVPKGGSDPLHYEYSSGADPSIIFNDFLKDGDKVEIKYDQEIPTTTYVVEINYIINTVAQGVSDASVYQIYKNDDPEPLGEKDYTDYTELEGEVIINIPVVENDQIKVIYYLSEDSVISINRKFYICDTDVNPNELITKIKYIINPDPEINPTPSTDLYSIVVNDTEEYLLSDETVFPDPKSGEISDEYNSDLLEKFNAYTLDADDYLPVNYKFRFNKISPDDGHDDHANRAFLYLDKYVDKVDSNKDKKLSPGDYYVSKFTLVNNTGMQWIPEE